jgi:hypothetical protein
MNAGTLVIVAPVGILWWERENIRRTGKRQQSE